MKLRKSEADIEAKVKKKGIINSISSAQMGGMDIVSSIKTTFRILPGKQIPQSPWSYRSRKIKELETSMVITNTQMVTIAYTAQWRYRGRVNITRKWPSLILIHCTLKGSLLFSLLFSM